MNHEAIFIVVKDLQQSFEEIHKKYQETNAA
jgi:hypothetical protein